MLVSIDGFIEDPNGSIEWSTPNEEIHRHFNALEHETAIHFCGRKLYNIMDFWRTAERTEGLHDYELEFAREYNGKPNFVFSRTLQKVQPGDTLMREIDIDFVKNLKKGPGKYISIGGSDLANAFLQLNLVDEIRLYIAPIILGGGKPMIQPISHTLKMKLVDTRSFKSGLVLLTYQN